MPGWLETLLPYVVLGACGALALGAVVLIVSAVVRRRSYPTSSSSDGPTLDEILRSIDKH